MLLLFAADEADGAVPGPCGGACAGRAQRLSQRGVRVFGMQLAEGGAATRGFSPLALPRRAFEHRRTQRAAPRAGEAGRRKASTCAPAKRAERTTRASQRKR